MNKKPMVSIPFDFPFKRSHEANPNLVDVADGVCTAFHPAILGKFYHDRTLEIMPRGSMYGIFTYIDP